MASRKWDHESVIGLAFAYLLLANVQRTVPIADTHASDRFHETSLVGKRYFLRVSFESSKAEL
jgi:hypothetical protein